MNQLNVMNMDYMNKLNLLNQDNKQAFLEVANYVKFSYSKSEQEANEILSDMLDHLLDAQAHGTQTSHFFGDDIQLFAQEIAAELPAANKTKLLYQFLFILFLNIATPILAYGISDSIKVLVTGSHFRIPITSTIICCLIFTALVSCITFFIIRTTKNNIHQKKSSKIIIYFLTFLMITVPILLFMFFPIGPVVSFKYFYAIPFSIVLFILTFLFYKRMSR